MYCSANCRSEGRRKHTGKVNAKKYYHKPSGRYHRQWWDAGEKRQMVVTNARWVWEQANGPIPPGHAVHHSDGNKTNDDLANLAILPRGEHTRKHVLGVSRKPVEIVDGVPCWACKTCGVRLPISSYRLYVSSGKRDGRCVDCERRRAREYAARKRRERAAQPEKERNL